MVWLKSLAEEIIGTSLFEQFMSRKYKNTTYKSAAT